MRAVLSFALAFALAPAEAPSAAPRGTILGDALAAVESARLEAGSVPAAGRSLQLGHLTLSFMEGSLHPIVGGDGTWLGLYFQGKGAYRYEVEDARDRHVFLRNLKRLAPNLIPFENLIEDRFQRAVLLSTLPLLPPSSATSGPAASPEVLQSFARTVSRLQRTHLPFEHLLAEARASGGEGSFQFAEIEGALATIGLRVDRLRGYEETLETYRTIRGAEPRYDQTIAFQDIHSDRAGPQILLRHADLAVRSSDRRSARISARLQLDPAHPGQRLLRFALLNQRDPRARLWTSRDNALHVRAVTDDAGLELPFSHRHDELLVELPEASRPGARVVLRVESEGEVLTALDEERGDQYVELCSAPWFPQPDDAGAPPFTYTLAVSMPKPFRPVASGTTTAFRETEDGFELESRGSSPARWIGVFAGRYRLHEASQDGVRYRVHSYAMGTRATQEGLVRLAAGAVRELSGRLGPPPFEELDLVEVPAWPSPLAPAGIALLTAEYGTAPRQRVGGNDTGIRHALFVHAVARQWIRNAPAAWARHDAWLEDAIAHYVTGEVVAALEPPDRTAGLWRSCLSEWRGFAKECADAAPLSRAEALGGELGEREGLCLLSSRGPLVLHMLRSMLGEERFRPLIRALVRAAGERALRPSDLQASIAAVSTADLSWFAGQWSDRWGIPEVEAQWKVDASGRGPALQLSLSQRQGPLFRLVLPVVLEYAGRSREVHLVVQDRERQEVRLPLPSMPRKVTIDPAGNNLAVYR